ncbi:MAG: hypothetical protein NTV49_03215, partial [Kiritimatiellaeota bacterium]|nr:hypothetical protein [Kiritimatiellota bacterium]
MTALQSRPAQVCLEPFYDFITARLAQHEHVADAPLLQALQTDARLDGWQPAGVLALMAALNPTRLQYRHDR